jgi:hypothetical protein
MRKASLARKSVPKSLGHVQHDHEAHIRKVMTVNICADDTRASPLWMRSCILERSLETHRVAVDAHDRHAGQHALERLSMRSVPWPTASGSPQVGQATGTASSAPQ